MTQSSSGSKGCDQIDIYSDIARLLIFSEERDTKAEMQMIVKTHPMKTNRLTTDFEVISKLGEGTFGEALKVRCHLDGKLYAVKKSKKRYLGFKDREQKLQEVHKALKLSY